MQILLKALALSAFGLSCAAPLALAAAPTIVTCTDSTDGITFSANVYQLAFDTSKDFSSFYFSIYTDLSKQNEALEDEFFLSNSFDTCTFSPGNGTTPEDLTITDTVASITPSGAFTQIIFTFKALSVGSALSAKARIAASKTPATAEQKARELAAFKAGLPAFTGVASK